MWLAAALSVSVLLTAADQPVAAQPVAPAVSRFHQVDDKLYRGAQPGAEGFRQLRDLGVRIVVNLRSERDAVKTGERRIVESLGMRYVSLPVRDGNFFTRSRIIPDETIAKFFETLDAAEGPVFVHCRRGADRTGALAALYRIARNGWDNERAYAEARAIGMRSWYSGLKRQILTFKPIAGSTPATPRL